VSTRRLTTSSANALERLRLVLLVPAVISAVLMLPDIARSHGSVELRAAGALGSLALAALWIWGYRRRGFPLLAGPPETAALALALVAAGGVPPLPLFGLVFRALYDGGARSVARLVSWLVVIWAVALEHGHFVFSDQFGKTAGLALAALLLHELRRTFGRLDHTESRLRAVVEQSTDIVTILEPDLSIRSDDPPGFVAGST
jgi:hypothetical protein